MSLPDRARIKAKAKAVAFLQTAQYHYVDELSQGKFSTVICITPRISRSQRAQTPSLEDTAYAAKVTTVSQREVFSLWRKFNHKNVVSLCFRVERKDFDIMVMPMYNRSLDAYLTDTENEFGLEPGAFHKSVYWLRDIAEGLSYLHGQEVCHLNLQPSNILIGWNGRAAIGGFGCIQKITEPTTNFGLPRQFSPPENWSDASEANRPALSGIPYDMWSLGMLAFNMLTGYSLENRLGVLRDWKIDLYPRLFVALQYAGNENFRVRLARAFPKSSFTNRDAGHSINFVRGLLRLNPSERPDTSMVLRHRLLSGEGSWFYPDYIWDIYQDRYSGVWSTVQEPSEIEVSGECEESLPPEKPDEPSECGESLTRDVDAFGDCAKPLPRENIDVSGECEESLPPETSAGVRSWLRRKWRAVRDFFCCRRPSDDRLLVTFTRDRVSGSDPL